MAGVDIFRCAAVIANACLLNVERATIVISSFLLGCGGGSGNSETVQSAPPPILSVSSGCTAVNSGSWMFSVTGGGDLRSDTFNAGDRLQFMISIGDPEFNFYAFSGALAAGGTSASATNNVNFSATAGTGSLALSSNAGVFPVIPARPISVTAATCDPAS